MPAWKAVRDPETGTTAEGRWLAERADSRGFLASGRSEAEEAWEGNEEEKGGKEDRG